MSQAGGSKEGKPASSDSGQLADHSAADQPTSRDRTATAVASPAPDATDGKPPLATADQPPATGAGVLSAIGRSLRHSWRRTWVRHVVLLLIYIAAGIALTWPRFTYLSGGKLPRTTDTASFVWGFWWIAHQTTHLGNPFFTKLMAAPVGIQLGFSTLMPLAGYVMLPVTLLWGPSAAFTSLSLICPGLLCYTMYRAARLWLNQPGSIAAGAFFGLSSMVLWQNWYHLNIALGLIFLPMTIEAAVRLRRTQKIAPAIWLGVALGAAVMTSQEGAAVAVLLAVVILVPWLISKLISDRPAFYRVAIPLVFGAAVAVIVASPQLIAMAQQIASGGAKVPVGTLANNYTQFGVPLQTLFTATPRLGYYGLSHFPSGYSFNAAAKNGVSVQPGEGLPGFGLVASVLAVLGVIIAWRKRATWLFLLLWLGCAALALGTSVIVGSSCVNYLTKPGVVYGRHCTQFLPLMSHIHYAKVFDPSIGLDKWEKVVVSNLMPYSWLVRIPWLSGLREADRFALVGMIGVALLAGIVVQWISERKRQLAVPLLVAVLGFGLLEAGWQGGTDGPAFTPTQTMPTAMPSFDWPIKADHSNSIVLDVPWGLRGGLSLTGSGISERAMLLATDNGHPRAASYTAWVPYPTITAIQKHPFFWYLEEYQDATHYASVSQLTKAAADLKTMTIGWAIEWTNLWRTNHPIQRLDKVQSYLRELGFRRYKLVCLVPSKPGTICGGRDLEKVWLLKFVPADAFRGHLNYRGRHVMPVKPASP